MQKQAIVKPGHTPSIKTGKASTKVVKGEALAKDEKPLKNTIENISKSLDN